MEDLGAACSGAEIVLGPGVIAFFDILRPREANGFIFCFAIVCIADGGRPPRIAPELKDAREMVCGKAPGKGRLFGTKEDGVGVVCDMSVARPESCRIGNSTVDGS